MKRYFYILYLCLASWILIPLLANAQDVQRFSEQKIMGTARYVGMGGAMTAIGGDPSAVIDNPAGLGLYRRSEISLTLDETLDYSQQKGSNDIYLRARFAVPQVSAIWALGNTAKQRGVIFSNFMFSINRLANFNRDLVVKGKDMGMVETICLKTNGLAEKYLHDQPWYDDEIGWLSILGYESYLIDPAENDIWIPAVDFTDGSLSITETGAVDQYTFSWATNISNQWYVGLNLNIPTLSYNKRISLLETDRIQSAEIKSLYHAMGVGFGGTIGVIYRPFQFLRLGASFQTPTWMALSVQTEGDAYTTIAAQSYEILTPESGVISTNIIAPLRSSISLAGQIGNHAMIAVQYDYSHAADMNDVHSMRIGLEVQAYRGLFINTGYVYESSFLKNEPIVGLDYNSVRTDMDYRYAAFSQYASAGIGYRSDVVTVQLAYQHHWQLLHQYATEMQEIPFDVHTNMHHIVATLAWRF